MYKRVIYILLFALLTSCGGTFDSIKRGVTGEKKNTADEFLVKKKDPLILPPDFENLPAPDERSITLDEDSIFQDTLEPDEEENASNSKSVESSILKKIQSK